MNNPAKLSKWVVLCLVMFAAEAHAQLNSFGRDFYCAYLKPGLKCPGATRFQSASLLISAPYESNITVSYFDHATGAEAVKVTKHIAAKQSATIPIDLTMAVNADKNGTQINADGEVPEYTAIHVQCDQPVTVQYYSSGPNAGGMYLVLPTPVLGKEYVASSYYDSYPMTPMSMSLQCSPDTGASEFAVLATEDNTNVYIVSAADTKGGEWGTCGTGDSRPHPFHVILQRGQVYWVKSISIYDEDISGSTVTSDKPIAVLGANEDAFHGYLNTVNTTEQRNLLVQEMIPVQYWADSDYLMMPFNDVVNSQNPGDEVRFLTNSSSTEVVTDADLSARPVEVYSCPPSGYENLDVASTFWSDSHHKFQVEQYDYRSQSGSIATAPAMMNVVARKDYARSFQFSVPQEPNGTYYMNIIASTDQFKSIEAWRNGQLWKLTPSRTMQFRKFGVIEGNSFVLTPGAYTIRDSVPFMVYVYGTGAMTLSGSHLTDLDTNVFFYEYASPVGMTFTPDSNVPPKVSLDTLCHSWQVHVWDPKKATTGGISQVELLQDPLGVLKRVPNGDSGYVSYNVNFAPSNYKVTVGDSSTSFTIAVQDQFKNAEAWLWFVNEAGSDTLVHLQYTAPRLGVTPSTISIARAPLKSDTCLEVLFHNWGGVKDSTYLVTGYHLVYGDSGYSVTNVSPALPHLIKPGDSVVVNVCLNAQQMAHHYVDTLIVQTTCYDMRAPLSAISSLAAINSDDYDFGSVKIGDTACASVRVWNSGTAPMTLTNQSALDDRVNFSFRDSSLVPVSIAPGETRQFNVCFTPQRAGSITAALHWMTDIPAPYNHTVKDMTTLHGTGIQLAAVSASNCVRRLQILSQDAGRSLLITLPEVPAFGASVSITDALGRTVRQIPAINDNFVIDATSLASGAYFLEYRGSVLETTRFTVIH